MSSNKINPDFPPVFFHSKVLVNRVAASFRYLLKEVLTDDQLAEVRRRNATPEYAEHGCCASHDFCDANMVMLEAFERVMGHEPYLDSEADMRLINEAWKI